MHKITFFTAIELGCAPVNFVRLTSVIDMDEFDGNSSAIFRFLVSCCGLFASLDLNFYCLVLILNFITLIIRKQ